MKKPQGLLIEGAFEETMERLKELVERGEPSVVVSVGDVVSRHMIEWGIPLNVLVVDNRTMRQPTEPVEVNVDQTINVKNPAGTITDEAWDAIKQAFKLNGLVRVMVDGEEDLLTVVTVLSAPKNAFVVYGQPHVGVVVVKVTEETQRNMQRIVDLMEVSSKN